MPAVTIGFTVYLVVVLIVGAFTYRLNRSQADFLLAGRKLNVWVATFSERASGESAWLLLGLPAAVMTVGLVESWTALGCVAGIGFAWWAVAAGLRRETEAEDALTLPQFLACKFGDWATPIRTLATLIIIFFYAFYVAAQFNGAGKVLNVTFGITHLTGIIIGAVVIIAYTMMGGFFAVAWTDLVQAIIMIGTLVVLPLAGLVEVAQQQSSIGEALAGAGNLRSWTGGATGLGAVAAVISGLSWGFGYAGQPHTVTRFMSIRNPGQIRIGRWVALAWAIPAFTGAVFIGLVGLALYDQGTLADPEQLMPRLATDLLPGWLAGIFISGAIAAMMSTADSQLLVGTSALAEDFYRRGLNKELTQARLVQISRGVTIVLGLAAFALALASDKLIFALVSYAWSGLGASFGPALLLTLHWKRTTGAGVFAGMLTGAFTTVLWSNLVTLNAILNARFVAFVLATAVTVLVSLYTSSTAARRLQAHPT